MALIVLIWFCLFSLSLDKMDVENYTEDERHALIKSLIMRERKELMKDAMEVHNYCDTLDVLQQWCSPSNNIHEYVRRRNKLILVIHGQNWSYESY